MMENRMMKMNIRIKALSVALFGMLGLWAQDSVIVKEVTVSQEYNPTVNDAFKLGTAPTTDAPETYTPEFDYSFFNAPLRTNYDIQFIGADGYTPPERMPLGRKNYIKGGGGNYSTLYGELYYNAYSSKEQNVNIFYRNRSSWGDVTLQNDQKVDAPMISNYGKVDFQRRYRYSILNSAIVFDRKGYEYYGYHTLEEGNVYTYYDDPTTPVSIEGGRQILTNIGFNIDLKSLPRRNSDIEYKAGFAFLSASNDDKFSENQLDFSGALDKALDKSNIGFEAKATIGFYGDAEAGIARSYLGDTYFDIEIAPYIAFAKKNWDLKVGAELELYQMGATQEVVAAPLLDFNFNIVPKYFTAYVTSGGGITKNTYAEVTQANPYVANDIKRKATRNLLDLGAGIIGNPTDALSLKLGVDYKIIQDQLFYVNEFVDDRGLVPNNMAYTNRFIAAYDDNNILSFHGEATYNTFKRWSASASFDYYSYSLNTLKEAWNMPLYKVSAFGHFDVTEKIRVKGTFVFLPERPVKVSEISDVDYLPVTYDLTLKGEYKLNKQLSFFLDMNNMLGSQYHYFNGYPAYRFNALAGATFRF